MHTDAVDPRRRTHANRPSLAETHKDLAAELDDDNFSAWELTAGSHRKSQWKCAERGHLWIARVDDRVRGRGCPKCCGQEVQTGENDLQTLNPALAAEWDFDANDLTPCQVTEFSNRKAHWRCVKYGHKWMAVISSRSQGSGCPKCSGLVVSVGENDLLSRNPALAAEWDFDANDITPAQVTAYSHRRAYWRCAKYGHAWMASVNDRSRGTGCPRCPRKKGRAGGNDLLSRNPTLAAEWDFSANDITPDQVTEFSNRKVHWRCAKYSHTWTASVSDRSRGRGCPKCSGREVSVGENDLLSRNPTLAAEWDFDANDITPDQVTAFSNRKAYWRCAKYGHAWSAAISSRSQGSGCPKCSGLEVSAGENDLLSRNPELAAEWDFDANDITPDQVTAYSHHRVYWRCAEHGHPWVATVNSRASGRGCPTCSKSQTSHVEKALFRDLHSLLDNCVNGDRIPLTWSAKQKTASVDILGQHRGRNIAVEYDGEYYHREKARFRTDASKTLALLEVGYLVVRVRESGLTHLDITDENLLQLNYQYRPGTDEQLDTYLAPVAEAILEWLGGFQAGLESDS